MAAAFAALANGDPRTPRPTPTAPAVIWGGDGRIAFSLRGVALWSDGATLHTVDAPGLRALLWRNEEHGAMIAAHGTLRTTHDGGATWRDVPLGDAAPLDLSSDGGALVVTTSEGRRTLRDDGTLAPTAPPLALRASPCATLLSVPASVHSLFERGYTRVDAARAECVTPPTEPASWEPPTVVVHLPRAGGPDQMESWVTPRGRPAPLGPPRTLTVVNTVGVPALVSATRPGDPSTGHPMTLAWRGEDERGAFSVRISITAPREIPVTASWRLVAATRAGLLVEAAAVADGTTPNADIDLTQCPPDLFWFSAAGERRLHVTPAGDEHPVGLALPDGGAVVLWRDEPRVHEDSCEGATVAAPPGESVVLHLDASGGVVARRNVFTSGARRPLIGLGQSGERWGAVVADGAALTLLPLDGGSVPFGAWSLGDTARACGATVGDRLHLLGGMTDEHDDDLAVTIGPQGDGPNFAEPRLLTLERAGGGACVRRVWGVQRLYDTADEDTGEDPGERFGAVRFTARGGRLVGPFDDGRRIANVSVTLSDRIGFMQDI
jgi:hypothetical protein